MNKLISSSFSRVVIPGAVSSACLALILGTSTATLAQSDLMSVPGAVPIVPPFRNLNVVAAEFSSGVMSLDGISCSKCAFRNMTLTYGGGEFALERPIFENVKIEFVGAAKNAKVLDAYLNALTSPKPPKQIPDPKLNPKIPIKKTITPIDLIIRASDIGPSISK